MKFIHIADVHLGVSPDAGKSWSGKREQDIWDSFAQVVEEAGRKNVDFLLISGDLFHSQPLKKDIREINYLFGKIPQTRIILMAGNHDYLRTKSCYLSAEWQENVYFFRQEEVGHFDFDEENVSIYGLSYWHRELPEDIYDGIIPEKKEQINILLAHGGDARHLPFSAEKILQNGFDYIAAGHIHKGGQLVDDRAVMAGSLEPTDCNDTGAHGYWMGEISKEQCQVFFYPVKKCEYCHEVFTMTAKTSEWEIMEWAKGLLAERPEYQYFRLFLQGKRDPDMTYDLESLSQLARIVDVTDQTQADLQYDKLETEYAGTLLEQYIRTLRKMPDDPVTKKALEYGVNALLGHQL